MYPFDSYPSNGLILLGKPKNQSNARHGKGFELQKLTKQTNCTYCQVSLVDDYYHWLLLEVDHVIPTEQAKIQGIPLTFYEDFINLVLCCAGCNGFDNRFEVSHVPQSDWKLQDFVRLRDEVFTIRSQNIASRRQSELSFFLSKPWESG